MKKHVFTLLICSLLLMAQPNMALASEMLTRQTNTVCYSNDLIVETATCTSASKSTSIADSYWNFTSAQAWSSANQAKGSYTLVNSITGQSISDNVTLTCSPTGTIS